MPGWYKACQIGRSEQQVLLQPCVQFAVSADWEAPGCGSHPIGELSQN